MGCHVPKAGGTFLNYLLNRDAAGERKCDLKLERHSLLSEYKNVISKEEWDDVYKFTSVRDPVERFVSYYLNHMIHKDKYKSISFEEKSDKVFFNNWLQNDYATDVAEAKKNNEVDYLKKVNTNIYEYYLSDEPFKQFDFIVDFENLGGDLFHMCRDYVMKNKDKSKEHHKICKFFYEYTSVATDFENRTVGSRYRPNPTKAAEKESQEIKKIVSHADSYFDEISRELFLELNAKDVKLYEDFKKLKKFNNFFKRYPGVMI